ncbi:MAG: SRPBCC family protein [Planctomycetota bacterium]
MKIEESLELPVDPGTLWPWLSTPERLGEWIGDVERFELRPPGGVDAGSRMVAHLHRGAPLEARVERAEPPRSLTLRASGLPNDLEVLLGFEVREHEGGSRLTVSAETELRGLMIFAENLIASKARAKLRAWTEALRARVAAR